MSARAPQSCWQRFQPTLPVAFWGTMESEGPPPVVGTGKPEDMVPPRIGAAYQVAHIPPCTPKPAPPPRHSQHQPVSSLAGDLFAEVRDSRLQATPLGSSGYAHPKIACGRVDSRVARAQGDESRLILMRRLPTRNDDGVAGPARVARGSHYAGATRMGSVP